MFLSRTEITVKDSLVLKNQSANPFYVGYTATRRLFQASLPFQQYSQEYRWSIPVPF
jgi:hypothetical protein